MPRPKTDRLRTRSQGHGSSFHVTVASMQIDKDMIINLLKERGHHDKAQQASDELPDKVDSDEHAGMLSRFGVDPKDLLGKLPGGLGDKLGGLLGDK